jgi:hypothetical protein
MTRRAYLAVCIFFLSFPFAPTRASVQEELSTFTKIIDWLGQIVSKLSQLGARIDKVRLVNYLHDLGRNFGDLLGDKRRILSSLAVRPIDHAKLAELQRKTQADVRKCGDKINEIAFLVSEVNEGGKIVGDLNRAMDAKTSWLGKIEFITERSSDEEIKAVAAEIKNTETALSDAVDRLAKITADLERSL